jgi:hypothetical protein
MSRDGFVITRPHPGSGIGSNLLSLAGAVWLAGRLGRSVVVDWRATSFLKDPARNYFTEFLEAVPEIQGVPVLYAGARSAPEDPEDERRVFEPHDVPGLLYDRPELPPFVVLTSFHGFERIDRGSNEAERHRRLKDFYRSIRPRADVAQAIAAFWDTELRDRFVVGLNISTGNGEYAKGQHYHGRVDITFWEHEKRFLSRIRLAFRRAVRALPRYLRDDARLFFATDSYPMHNLLAQLPAAATRRTFFPPPGVGRVYGDYADQGYSDAEAAQDTVADMLMLARCNAFVRNTGSVFNTYALVTTDWFNGNVQDLDRLFARYWWRTAQNVAARRLARR